MKVECRICGAENEANDSYCHQCGERLLIVCSECGELSKPTARFCSRCGAAVAASNPKVAQQFHALRTGGGERKFVSVLFADIKDSTQQVQGQDPEVALKRIAPVLKTMSDAVHEYDGVVAETLGDGVLALFGTPKPLEDHAVRACLAGLAIQERVQELGDDSIRIRVGVHSGEAVIKAVDSTLTHKLGAIGEVVHFANRVEQLCAPGEVTISEAAFKQARQYIDAHSLGLKEAKGFPEAVEVYRVAGLRNAPASSIFRTRDKLQPLAGRAEQIAQLESALECAVRGQAYVVSVIGEAGVGKSRICYEFVESCRRRDISILEARAAPFGEATPLKPVLDLLQDFFRIRPIADVGLRREAVTSALDRIRADKAETKIILELLGLSEEKEAKSSDPSVRKSRLIKFICGLVRQGPDARPAIVLIEDLHWLDAASMEILDAMVDAAYGSKTMLLLNFRPGTIRDWMQRSHYRAINLDTLDSQAMDALAIYSLGEDESLERVRADLVSRSHGNPFFLEELTWALIQSGGLEGKPGAYRATRSLNVAALPATIQGVLSTRIDALDRLPKKVLQIAAVIARDIPVEVLGEVAAVPRDDLEDALQTLRRAELIYEMPRVQESTLVAFRHPLIQEVAYHNLLNDRKAELHGAVAKALLRHFQNRMDEGAAILAYHFEKSGDMLNAAQAYARSATWLGANDSRQALAAWRKVDSILRSQPARPDIDFLRSVACGQIVNFSWREGLSADEVRGYFEEASRLALATKNFRGNALIHAAYGRILAAAGSADEYVAKIREAQSLGNVATDKSLRVTLEAVLAHALRLSGRLNEALAANGEALNHCSDLAKFEREMLGFDLEPWLLAMRGQTLVSLGLGEDARPILDRVIAMEREGADPTHLMVPSLAYVEWAWATKDLKLAEEHALRAIRIAKKSDSPYWKVYAEWAKGVCQIATGNGSEAIETFANTLAFARKRKIGLENEARLLADLANAYLVTADPQLALEIADEAIAVSRARHQRVPECYARLVKGWAAKTLENAVDFLEEQEAAGALLVETSAALFRLRFDHNATMKVA
jgi:adenylate cyclase